MSVSPHQPQGSCWKRIGVYGDGSCTELHTHIHCRNCPVYSAAGIELLDRPLPDGHLADWAKHYAIENRGTTERSAVAFIFRIGSEWLSVPPDLLLEVMDQRPIHSLPHRDRKTVLGLVNVRGELLVCISLAALLNLQGGEEASRRTRPRLLVIQQEACRFVFPVDEVHGTHRYDPGTLADAPATVGHLAANHTRAVLPWAGNSVGCLDPAMLFAAFNRSLA